MHLKEHFHGNEALVQVTDLLLQSVLSSSSTSSTAAGQASTLSGKSPTTVALSEARNRLSWDRMDSVASTLITYIALDKDRFAAAAQYMVSLQPAANQEILMKCLNKLATARNVNLDAIDKLNRNKFTQNFREFVSQVKSLSLA
jgi:hypothetical protein